MTPRTRTIGIVISIAGTVLVTAVGAGVWHHGGQAAPASTSATVLTPVASIALPGDTSRYDYASLDPDRHLLFIAHLGAGQILQIDTVARRVVRVIDHVDGVHGVLVVPSLRRVFATATDLNQVLTLDEDTGAVLGRAPTGAYPDGLAYDPTRNQVWVTNESGGTQTVLDPATQAVLATVDVGGDAGNVAYDPGPSTPAGIGPGAPTQGGTSTPATGGPGQILVDVQSRNEVAVIDPDTHTVTRRVPVPGCQHPHGLTLDPGHRLGFIACDGNATVHTLDLDTLQVRDPVEVGADPDVLAFDHTTGWLYVAAESGTLTVLAEHDRHLQLLSRSALTDGAHVVAVDPATHDSYYPLAAGPGGHPELLIEHPSP